MYSTLLLDLTRQDVEDERTGMFYSVSGSKVLCSLGAHTESHWLLVLIKVHEQIKIWCVTSYAPYGDRVEMNSAPELLSYMPDSPLGRVGGKVLIQKRRILFNKFLRIV